MIIDITLKHKDLLNNYVLSHEHGSLYQTYEWGEFLQQAGFKVWRLGIMDEPACRTGRQKLCAAVSVFRYDMPGGKWYLYAPRMLDLNKEPVSRIKEIANQENCIFFRFDPLVIEKNWDDLGETKAPKEIQPKDTVMIDLNKPEDDILKNMKSKWRYNIRLAKRKGVTIRQSTDLADLDKFYEIARVTSERDKFHIHEKQYYEALFRNLVVNNWIKLFVAEYEGEVLAVNIVSFYKDTVTYMHGASSNEHRNLMAPHLLQWEAILEAKKQGFAKYDFYGVAPENEPNHAWSGISRFKLGFGGKRVSYVGAYDIVYKKFWYSAMKIMVKIKK